MDEQRAPGHWWRYGPPWGGAPDEAEPRRAPWPWRSTVLLGLAPEQFDLAGGADRTATVARGDGPRFRVL
ncbi:hypothetical protein ACWEN3_36840, partial [Streptomyces sp. NPDC004561]